MRKEQDKALDAAEARLKVREAAISIQERERF
jgi:hypothetical protein